MKLEYREITCSNAMEVLAAGIKAIENGDGQFDLSEVKRIDSSAIAVAIKWKKETQSRNLPLRFINVPANLKKLADLYSVTPLLT